MTDLRDLRRTLDAHAHDLHDAGLHDRAASVRGRVRTVQRRRASAVVAAAVLGIGTATGVALLPDRPDPRPAGRTVLGEVAPATIRAAGWTYRFTERASTDDDSRVSAGLAESDRPRLVSWTTAGEDQDVRVRLEGGERWVSDADDFTDFMWVPPGYAGDVRVDADRPGVGLAIYEVDESVVPDGVTRDGITFRDRVGGQRLVGAEVGEPGETDLSFTFPEPEQTVSIAYTCRGLPRDAAVHISLDGSDHGAVIRGCDESFDPGSHTSYSFPEGIGVPAGQQPVARIWATRDMRDTTPLDPADFPDAVLGLGVYTFDEEPLRLAGMEVPRTVESRGRLWRLDFSQQVSGAPGIDRNLPAGSGPWLVTAAFEAGAGVSMRLRVGDRGGDTYGQSSPGAGAVPETLVPPGTRTVIFTATRGGDRVQRLGLAFYRLAE